MPVVRRLGDGDRGVLHGVFPDSAIEDVGRYTEGGMGGPGSIMIVTF